MLGKIIYVDFRVALFLQQLKVNLQIMFIIIIINLRVI